MILIALLLFVGLPLCTQGLNNGQALIPSMGYNSWNFWGCAINETLIRQTANALVSTGLAKAGYVYVNLDDCWQLYRDADNRIVADPKTFPSGIPALAEYVHGLGLKFGLYSDAGNKTCQGRPGSLGHETIDAQTYAEWKVDYLKYDNCYNDEIAPEKRYPVMSEALNKTGHPLVFSMCEWGVDNPAGWAGAIGNSWRTTADIENSWQGVIANIGINERLWRDAEPGSWNDPDMLEVGNGVLTVNESRSHFSLWVISKSPLLIGCDLTSVTTETLNILSNSEVIAVSQDKLGVQGHIVSRMPPNGKAHAIANPCNTTTPTQRWTLNQDGTIKNNATGLCLEVIACRTSYNAPVGLTTCGKANPECGTKNQLWSQGGNGSLISALGKNICIDVFNNQGPNVVVFGCSGAGNQNWTLGKDGLLRSGTKGNVATNVCLDVESNQEVWATPLEDGSAAVLLFNKAEEPANITVTWNTVWEQAPPAANVRDLWAHAELGKHVDSYTTEVIGHGVEMFKVIPFA